MRTIKPVYGEWRLWFAWRPIRFEDQENGNRIIKVWLEQVARRRVNTSYGSYWQYRIPTDSDLREDQSR